MTNMSNQPLWLTYFIEILLVLEFQLTKFIVAAFSYKAHFRPQISSNDLPCERAKPYEESLIVVKSSWYGLLNLNCGFQI